MDELRGSFNRRSFLKRTFGTAAVLTSIPVLAKIPSASAATLDTAVTASVSDLTDAAQFTVVRWQGPADAVVQLRRLSSLGVWSEWETLHAWGDLEAEGNRSPSSGLIRTQGARALQARALSDNVSQLTITRV